MRHTISILMGLSLFSLNLAGCGAAPDVEGDDAPLDHAAGISPTAHPPSDTVAAPWQRVKITPPMLYAVPDLLAWTTAGDLVLVDGRTGAVRQTLTTLHLDGERDVAFDPVARRVWVAETDVDAPVGEAASYAMAGSVVGARVFQAEIAGGARLVPAALGAVLFEDTGAWRLLAGGGGASASVAGPRPMSAWISAEPGSTQIRALAYGPASGELSAASAAIGPGSVAKVAVSAIDVEAGGLPPSARVVPAPARGGALMLDISGSFLTVRALDGASVGAAAHVPLGASGLRIESAVSLQGGALLAVLLSGVTEIVAIHVDAGIGITSMAKVALAGVPLPSTKLFSHDLVDQGLGRIAAATSAGVYSIALWKDAIGVHLAMDPTFAGSGLRGPLAAVPAK